MTRAYSELYISHAQTAMGSMLDYAVCDLKWELNEFYTAFINSGVSYRFGIGDPKYIAGMSGIEIARDVIMRVTGRYEDRESGCRTGRSAEYWTGWSLAYYEWYRDIPFEKIERTVPVTQVVEMYNPYHEADISKFVAEIDKRIYTVNEEKMLARLRAYAGLTQKALAERSGVSVRMIEQYEQGKKDLEHAQAATVVRLARALNCRVEDLL